MLAIVLIVAALAIFLKLRYAGKALVRLPAESCNADLWKHVYQPDRLRVIEACTSVEGRVASMHRAADGDLHIGLDPDHKSILNVFNLVHAQGKLVVEVVCEHAPKKDAARIACEGFTPQVTVPTVGDRISVYGAYVTDRDDGSNEIHPVTRIGILH